MPGHPKLMLLAGITGYINYGRGLMSLKSIQALCVCKEMWIVSHVVPNGFIMGS